MRLAWFFVFWFFLYFRLLNLFFVRTYYVPDEYWQSLEVAHNMVYHYGYLTWEWRHGIRSYIYPLFFASFYKLMPDSRKSVVMLPRYLQLLLSTVGDLYTVLLSWKLHGNSSSRWTFFSILTSWFLFYCSTRTLTNMVESSLTSIALYYYPWSYKDAQKPQSILYTIPVAISLMIRPTTAVTWLGLYIWHFYRIYNCFSSKQFRYAVMLGLKFFIIMLAIDYIWYGKFVITPLKFFHFNWNYDVGSFYGTHPIYWYFTAGLPAVLATHFVPFIFGWYTNKTRKPFSVIAFFLTIFSLTSHKEFRFLLPILPLCLCIVGHTLSELSNGRLRIRGYRVSRNWIYICVLAMVSVNAVLSLYAGLVHQRGVMEATQYLAENTKNDSSLLFLMPCHSTPYYSYIHKNITMRFLTCEPNLSFQENYVDEADQFYENPVVWLKSYFSSPQIRQYPPSHIMMFDKLYPVLSNFMTSKGYSLCYDVKNTDYDDGRIGKFVYILCPQDK